MGAGVIGTILLQAGGAPEKEIDEVSGFEPRAAVADSNCVQDGVDDAVVPQMPTSLSDSAVSGVSLVIDAGDVGKGLNEAVSFAPTTLE